MSPYLARYEFKILQSLHLFSWLKRKIVIEMKIAMVNNESQQKLDNSLKRKRKRLKRRNLLLISSNGF